MTELEKTEREISEYEAELQKLRLEKSQREHQLKAKEQQIKNLYRKTRTHRLIERGAMLEKFLPDAENLTNDEVLEILRKHFGSEDNYAKNE